VLHVQAEQIFEAHLPVDFQKLQLPSQNRFPVLVYGGLHQAVGMGGHQLVLDKGQINGLPVDTIIEFQDLMAVILPLAHGVVLVEQGTEIGLEQLQFGDALEVQHIEYPVVLGADHMDRDKKGTSVKKLEESVVVVEDGIHFLDATGKGRKGFIVPQVAPCIALGHLFPAFHRLLGFKDKNGILGNQVYGLQIGLWG